jgi:hypothetical protein
VDEEGHLFPRGVAVEVCTDTAAKLSGAPYAGSFTLIDADGSHTPAAGDDTCCAPDGGCC